MDGDPGNVCPECLQEFSAIGIDGDVRISHDRTLRPEEVYSALTYFYDHHDELVAAMKAVAAEIDSLRGRQKLSRAELLARTKEPA